MGQKKTDAQRRTVGEVKFPAKLHAILSTFAEYVGPRASWRKRTIQHVAEEATIDYMDRRLKQLTMPKDEIEAAKIDLIRKMLDDYTSRSQPPA